MIFFRTSGGRLGNQIFQLVYALTLRHPGESIRITDIRELAGVFDLPEGVTDIHAWNRPLSRLFRFGVLQLAAAVRLINGISEERSADYECVRVHKTRGLLPITYISCGWYQDYRHPEALGESLPVLCAPLLQAAHQWHAAHTIPSVPIYFCHLRRTDYASHLDGVTLPLRYYESAIPRLRTDPDKALLLIATDDLEFAQLAFGHLPNIRFVAEGPELTFAILSLCSAGIISNSTFAWWAGYAVARRGGRIIAPRHFLGWRTGRETPPGIETPLFEWIVVPPPKVAL